VKKIYSNLIFVKNLLLLLLSSSPLYRVFTRMSPRQTLSLGDILLQLLFRSIVNTLYSAYLPRSYVGYYYYYYYYYRFVFCFLNTIFFVFVVIKLKLIKIILCNNLNIKIYLRVVRFSWRCGWGLRSSRTRHGLTFQKNTSLCYIQRYILWVTGKTACYH
jgi:hypothetical protein